MKKTLNSSARISFLAVFILLITITRSFAAPREIGGYVDRAEDRFVRNVWNFIKNFDGWQTVGSHQWKRSQYFWGEPFEFTTSHQSFVDFMDLSYVACHGSPYYIQTNQSTGDGVDLRNAPAYGDLANLGDLEFLIIESCYTVATAPDVSGDWWTPWTSIFQGLHQLVGFHTLSNSDNGIPNNYANKLKANGSIWLSWFDAVNEERYWIGNPTNPDGSPYPGFASAIMYNSTQFDRLGSYAPDPAGGSNDMLTWWQY